MVIPKIDNGILFIANYRKKKTNKHRALKLRVKGRNAVFFLSLDINFTLEL